MTAINRQIRNKEECEMKTIIVIVLFVILSSTAYAGCMYEGKEYPTGTEIGSMVCGSDGYWIEKQGVVRSLQPDNPK
jgi:hypothetical protein